MFTLAANICCVISSSLIKLQGSYCNVNVATVKQFHPFVMKQSESMDHVADISLALLSAFI